MRGTGRRAKTPTRQQASAAGEGLHHGPQGMAKSERAGKCCPPVERSASASGNLAEMIAQRFRHRMTSPL
jgi:hypothetical protein